jgi:hypothetical protein
VRPPGKSWLGTRQKDGKRRQYQIGLAVAGWPASGFLEIYGMKTRFIACSASNTVSLPRSPAACAHRAAFRPNSAMRTKKACEQPVPMSYHYDDDETGTIGISVSAGGDKYLVTLTVTSPAKVLPTSSECRAIPARAAVIKSCRVRLLMAARSNRGLVRRRRSRQPFRVPYYPHSECVVSSCIKQARHLESRFNWTPHRARLTRLPQRVTNFRSGLSAETR